MMVGVEADLTLRPKRLDDYVGQAKLKEKLRVYLEAAKNRGRPSITCCSLARRGWARPPWPTWWPTNWG